MIVLTLVIVILLVGALIGVTEYSGYVSPDYLRLAKVVGIVGIVLYILWILVGMVGGLEAIRTRLP